MQLKLLQTKLKRPVTIVNPNRTYALKQNPKACSLSSDLKKVATGMVISINDNLLAGSQFPIVLVDDKELSQSHLHGNCAKYRLL